MAKKNKDGLTVKQVKYCQNRAKGLTQRESYIKAGYSSNQKPNSIDVNASDLEKMEKIKKKIEELQRRADNGCILTTEQRKQALADFYLDDTKSDKDRLKAIDLLNRMSGDYIDKKEINATIQGITRDDRLSAMQETLESLKKAWNGSDGKE